MYAALLDEVDGTRLFTPARLREATAVAATGTDEIFGMPTTWSLGYGIGDPGHSLPTRFGVPGAGGSAAWADTTTGLTFALTKNLMTNDFTTSTRIADLITGN